MKKLHVFRFVTVCIFLFASTVRLSMAEDNADTTSRVEQKFVGLAGPPLGFPLVTAAAGAGDAGGCQSGFENLTSRLDSAADQVTSRIDFPVCSKLETLTSRVSSVSDQIDSCCSQITSRIDFPVNSKLEHIICGIDKCVPIKQSDLATSGTAAYVINAPGVYCVMEPLTFAAGVTNGIEIVSDNVVLDIQGHVLDASALPTAGLSSGVLVSKSPGEIKQVTVKNGCIVLGGSKTTAMKCEGMVGFIIDNITIEGNDNTSTVGISIVSSSSCGQVSNATICGVNNALSIDSSHTIQVFNSRFDAGSSSNNGFSITDGQNVLCRDITIQGFGSTGGVGLLVRASNSCLFERTTITECVGSGLAIGSESADLVFKNCVCSKNGGSGILFSGDTTIVGCIFDSCVSSGNGDDGAWCAHDIVLAAIPVGNHLEGHRFLNCSFVHNGLNGFRLGESGGVAFNHGHRNFVLDNCVFLNNAADGFTVESDGGETPLDNVIKNCTATGNGGIGFDNGGAGTATDNTFFSNTAGDNTGGNFVSVENAKVVGGLVTDKDIGAWVNIDLDVVASAEPCIPIRQSDLGSVTIPGFGPSTAGYVIDAPGVYCVMEPLTFTAATDVGIVIRSTDVTLDIQGHSLTNGSTVDTGIAAFSTASDTVERVEVKNGFISGFDSRGISCGGVYDFIIRDCISQSNTTDGIAIEKNPLAATPSQEVLIENVSTAKNGRDGVAIGHSAVSALHAKNIKLIDVRAIENGFSGVTIAESGAGSAENIAVRSGCFRLNTGIGIRVRDAASKCTINNCESTDNTSHGFVVSGKDIIVQGCTALRNGGIGFDNSGAAVATDNLFVSNVARTNTGGDFSGLAAADPVSTPSAATSSWHNIARVP